LPTLRGRGDNGAWAKAGAKLAATQAYASATDAATADLKLEIAKLKRERFGVSSERTERLLDQLELQLAEQEAASTEDDVKTEMAAAKTSTVRSVTRKRTTSAWFAAPIAMGMSCDRSRSQPLAAS
jgi:hypothetical protein